MKRLFVLVTAVFVLVPAIPALAAPSPSPVAPAHTTTACQMVLAHNPNTGPAGHISAQGIANLSAVGAAFCGL